jgi:hypothetical protein
VLTDMLGRRLASVLEMYTDRWNPDCLGDPARRLREFGDMLEKPGRAGKR